MQYFSKYTIINGGNGTFLILSLAETLLLFAFDFPVTVLCEHAVGILCSAETVIVYLW